MESICLEKLEGISGQELAALVTEALREREPLKKVLIIPPDLTRAHSRAGSITRICWDYLKDHAQVHILPALGTHMPMNEAELRAMFGPDIPKEAFLPHNWRRDVITLGEVPAELIEEYSEGKLHFPIEVQLNRHILDSSYDLILSVGQVVPHEVVGMANHSKNLFVGCGGESMINRSHFLGAVYGMERMMGRDHSPVRKVFDYAAQQYLKDLPLTYILTVVGQQQGHTALQGVYIGEGREPFNRAVALSQKQNLDLLDEPLKKVVVFLDPEEFRSTWLGNKAVYRTRLAIADGGELLVIAPGVCRFGEDAGVDLLIRKYGYRGTEHTLQMVEKRGDLRGSLSAAAHLIHGSSEGRFTITYAPVGLTKEEVEGVGFSYLPYEQAVQRYPLHKMQAGYNTMPDGEEVFFIPNPALGLWALKSQFEEQE